MADNIIGLGELTAKLKKLDGLSKKTAAKMVAAAGAVIRKEAKSIAQSKGLRKTGSLIKNIAIKRERNVPQNTVQYNVGVRHGREFGKKKNVVKYLAVGRKGRIVTKYKDDPFYWRFLEFGTKNINARPFIAPALDRKRNEAVRAMEAVLDKEILKAKL